MTKYDTLDPRRELEQAVPKDLVRALGKREFAVQHNGSRTNNAPGDKLGIGVFDSSVQIAVELTQTVKSGADREFLSIKAHLEKALREYMGRHGRKGR